MRKGHTYLRILGVIVILAGIALVAFYTMKQNEEAETMPSIDGEVACLPLKTGEKVNETSCVKGLKNKAGLYLAVESVPQTELKVGEKKTVEGNLKPVTDDKSPYMISGTIIGK